MQVIQHGNTASTRQEVVVVENVVPDTGAMLSLMPSKTARRLFPGCKFPPTKQVCVAANGSELELRGEFQAIVSCKDTNGDDVSARVRFYLSDHVSEVYLSLSAMRSLRMVHADFPTPQCAAVASGRPEGCECLERVKPPPKPRELPFEATQENIPRMKAWLLQRYAASTFNKCTHAPLPEMEGPP